MQFRVLGPLEVRDASGDPVLLRGGKHRALISLLLLEPGRVVSVDRLIDQLWAGSPPQSALLTLQSYVSQLRRILEPERRPRQPARVLLTSPLGYSLSVPEGSVDAVALEHLVTEGQRLVDEGRIEDGEARLSDALLLWRGDPYQDLSDSAEVVAARARLEDLRLTAQEKLAFARIRLGRANAVVGELERLVASHPLRETLWARLIEALYASGRQADALSAYQRCASHLRDELGLDPGQELVALEHAVLNQSLDLGARTTPAAPADPPTGHPTRPSGWRRDLKGPLVGRERETELARAALAQTAGGSGGVLVLEGEAGIGKTRLAEEIAAMAERQGWRSAWTRCADDPGAPPLWPWSQLLAQLRLDSLHQPTGEDPDRSRFGLFEELRARLDGVASRVPLLLVLDDVQAADASSLQLLSLLAQHLEGLRLLVVVTVRTVGEELSEPVRDCLARLAREAAVLRLQLTGLDEHGVEQLLAAGLGPRSRRGLAQRIHRRTRGNPFFVVELSRLIGDSTAEEMEEQGASLPPSVRDVLARRLGGLPAATLSMVQLAAVAGSEVDLPVLQRASGATADEVIAALEPALGAGIMLEEEAGWEWRFSHGLVQEALLAGLTRLESARLHHRVAVALESAAGTAPVDPGRLAHHYFHAVPAAPAEQALRHVVAAAESARSRLAHAEAATHTRRALKLLEALPGPTHDDRHRLLVALAEDLLRSGEPDRAQEAVGRALELARQDGDRQRLAEAASVWGGVSLWNWRPYGVVDGELVDLLERLVAQTEDDPGRQARLLGTLGVELAYSSRREDGIAYAETAVRRARELDDVPLLGRTLNNFSLVAWGSPGSAERRLAAADESLSLVGRGLPTRTQFFAHLHRGPLRLHLGDVAGFEADLADASHLAAGLPGPEVRPHLLYQQVGRAMLRGQWQEAEALAEEVHELQRRTSIWGARMSWALHQFTLRRAENRLGSVLDLLVEVADAGVPLAQAVAVVAAAEAGERREAERLLHRWPLTEPQDWTTDALLVVRAWQALALDGDVVAAHRSLLPYRGRQIVVGTATACWGSYDAVLSALALAAGNRAEALGHAREARRAGERVGSPWQVRHAEDLLAAARVG